MFKGAHCTGIHIHIRIDFDCYEMRLANSQRGKGGVEPVTRRPEDFKIRLS
jgi:hypothetical protein